MRKWVWNQLQPEAVPNEPVSRLDAVLQFWRHLDVWLWRYVELFVQAWATDRMKMNCDRKCLCESAKRFCGRLTLRPRTVQFGERLINVQACMSQCLVWQCSVYRYIVLSFRCVTVRNVLSLTTPRGASWDLEINWK